MRTVFWGTDSLFSHAALAGCLAAHVEVAAVFVYDRGVGAATPADPPAASGDDVPLLTPYVQRTTTTLAWQRAIPVWRVGDVRHEATAQTLTALAADVAWVACFPRRLPPSLLAVPRYGLLNVHPSLLPFYRGPSPVFWQLRDGVTASGVTVHWMDAEFDTGALAAQSSVTLPNGASGPEIDMMMAVAGANALDRVLARMARGAAPRHPQPDGGSYRPWPEAGDFALNLEWSAQHAFNFMRGTAEWGMPFALEAEGARWLLKHALRVAPAGELGAPWQRDGDVLHVQFAPGVLTASVA